MRVFLTAAMVTLGVFSGAKVHADTPVVVFVESSDSTVTSQRVRERMRESGVGAMGAADAPAGPIATLAIVYRGAGEQTRFRLRTLDGRVVVRDSAAPSANPLQWVVRKACLIVRASASARREAPARRAATEVLNPWDESPAAANRATSHSVVNPWDTAEEPRRRRRRRSVGRVAGASVTRYSEVLDPWSQSGRDGTDIVDPWDSAEGGDGLARPERRRR
ncbi:MAG: hypothetical protein ACI9KE_001283 [Polyangiales bacterium]|jgi:hypothetical protein